MIKSKSFISKTLVDIKPYKNKYAGEIYLKKIRRYTIILYCIFKLSKT